MHSVVLASASPRRQQLLKQLGIDSIVEAAHIDERQLQKESVESYVLRLAQEKALAIAGKHDTSMLVVGADTAVVIDGEALGKPRNREHAFDMWQKLSGREHQVLTAVALIHDNVTTSALSRSQVRFRSISQREMADYWLTGEPQDKAGGYAVQGVGALFIESISGSYSGIMGLPLYETGILLAAAGMKLIRAKE